MSNPNIDTKALRALEAKATPTHYDSWVRDTLDDSGVMIRAHDGYVASVHWWSRPQEEVCANADLIVALRNAAPALLDAAEERDRLKAEVEAERNEARGYREQFKTAVGHYTTLRARLGLDGFATVEEVLRKVDTLRSKLSASEAEVERLREALTPSGATKAAYMGEFTFFERYIDDNGEFTVERRVERTVPWTTIKDIMAAISKRADAALRSEEGEVQS